MNPNPQIPGEGSAGGPDVGAVERLVMEMARAFSWVSMYQSGHSSLSARIEPLHREMAALVRREPSGRLLLGIAKDKVLYRDVFLGVDNPLIRRFAETLFLKQVATVELSKDVSGGDLLSFFLCLQRARTEEKEARLEDLLKKEGVRGIGLSPYNYKEVLSRRIVGTGEAGSSSTDREDALWRMLLTENIASGALSTEGLEGLQIQPQLMASLLRRAHAARGGQEGADDPREGHRDILPPEMLRGVLCRIEEVFRQLPPETRCEILLAAENAPGGESAGAGEENGGDAVGQSVIRSLAGSQQDGEFLDLLSAVLAVEGKGGKRLRKIFSVIASERNRDDSLLASVRGRLGESLRTKNYFAGKTWEAVERLLLERSEDAYIGQDHSNLLEELSADESFAGGDPARRPPADPAALGEFEAAAIHRKGAEVLLELLEKEENEGDFLELLEEIRKRIPNLVSRNEFLLLHGILTTLTHLAGTADESRKPSIESVIGELDFAHMLDLYLSPGLCAEDRGRIEEIIVSFVELSIGDFLTCLLMETDQARRRTLLSLAARFDGRALPGIRSRLDDPHWYFVRNLCFLLGEVGDPGAGQDLVRLLEHESFQVRREAIQALGKVGTAETSGFLGKILLHDTILGSSKTETLRIEAANALFRRGGTRGASFIHRGAQNCRGKVRNHCVELLRTMETQR